MPGYTFIENHDPRDSTEPIMTVRCVVLPTQRKEGHCYEVDGVYPCQRLRPGSDGYLVVTAGSKDCVSGFLFSPDAFRSYFTVLAQDESVPV